MQFNGKWLSGDTAGRAWKNLRTVWQSEALRFCGLFYGPWVAERQGFEPWVPVRVQRFSRPSRSTTPASFLGGLRRQNYKLFWTLQNSFAFFCHLIPIVVNNSLTACDILSLCRLRHFMNNDPIMAPDELPKASCSVAGLDIPNPMSLLCCSGMRLMRLK